MGAGFFVRFGECLKILYFGHNQIVGLEIAFAMKNHPPAFFHLLMLVLGMAMSTPLMSQQSLVSQVAEDPSQVIYPYNPDEDASGIIGAGDLLPFLIYFGNPVGFYESDLDVDPMMLENVLGEMASLVLSQQEVIDDLQEQLLAQQQAVAALAPLLSLVSIAEKSSYVSDTWMLEGMNLQLMSGAGNTYGEANGLGNLIVGYNENEGGHHEPNGGIVAGEIRTGSHNIVLGSGHTYSSNGAFVGGYNNSALGQGASLFSGQASLATGSFSSVVGGLDNRAVGSLSAVLGGHSNTADGDRATVSGGLLNESAGIATSILGGQYMQVFEQYETASGQYDIND